METTITAGGAGLGYPDSVDSSLRSYDDESWDKPFPSSATASMLRLMCTFGDRINWLSTNSASVNCLLGLDNDSSVHSYGRGRVRGRAGDGDGGAQSEQKILLPCPNSSRKFAQHSQDAHSIPDSLMLETNSSFGFGGEDHV